MKTVWRKEEFLPHRSQRAQNENEISEFSAFSAVNSPVWTLSAPGGEEKIFGKHPTQKPVALIERCLLASTNEGDLVLDPFMGGGTTCVAAIRLRRGCVGIELDEAHAHLAKKRIEQAIGNMTDHKLQQKGKLCQVEH